MNRDALEQALALQQSPTLRFSVRDQPLAPNLLTVIQLAAASQPLLGDTARRLDMGEDSLLEAVRFYLQQALFEGEPEAYRTLAVAPDADIADIRERYRWLQRWLHPDRRGEDWESLFTSRLNWAWSLLRNDAARAAYDEQRRQTPPASALATPAPGAPEGVAMANGEWRMVPIAQAPSPRRYLKSMTVGAVFLLCCGLLYLAIVRDDAVLPHVRATRDANLVAVAELGPEPADTSTAAAALALDTGGSNTGSAAMDAAFAAGVASGKQLTQGPKLAHGRTDTVTPTDATARIDDPGVDGAQMPPPRDAITGGPDAAPSAQVVSATPAVLVALPPRPGPAPVVVPTPKPTASAVALVGSDPGHVTAPTRAPHRPEARATDVPAVTSPVVSSQRPVPAANKPEAASPLVAPKPIAPTAKTVALAAQHKPSNRPTTVNTNPVTSPTIDASMATTAKPASLTLLGAVGMPGATRPVAQAVSEPASPPSAPPPTPVSPPASVPSAPLSAVDLVARIDVAREHVRQLVAYFRSLDAGAPHWPDAHAPYSAQQTRHALRERNGLPLAARFTLDPPQWRMSGEAVAVEAGYRVGRERGVAEQGQLRVDMVWGGDAWQLTRVELEPRP